MIVYKDLVPNMVSELVVLEIQKLLHQLSPNVRQLTRVMVIDICQKHDVIVAMDTVDGRKIIVGMATLIVIEQLVGKRGRVEDVVVDAAYRGRHIARELMEELHKTAERRGVTRLALSTRPDRQIANTLYLSLGYKLTETNIFTIDLSKD